MESSSGAKQGKRASANGKRRSGTVEPFGLTRAALLRFGPGLVRDGLVRSPRSCSVARCISTAVSDVLDERAQLGQGLTSAGVVKKHPGRCDGETCKDRLQSAVRNRLPGHRGRHLRESYPLDRCSKQGGVVVRDERPGDDRLDRLVAIDKGPGRNRPVRATRAQAGVLPQIVDTLRNIPVMEIARDCQRPRRGTVASAVLRPCRRR